jgi:Subtilase family
VTPTQGLRIGVRALRAVFAGAGALLVLLVLCAAAGAAESAVESPVLPLPTSDYTVRAVCAAPAPGDAGCLAMELMPRGSKTRSEAQSLAIPNSGPLAAPSPKAGEVGLRPEDLHKAYDLPEAAPTTQTIALVDAYNDPTAEVNLEAYDKEFNLPPCTKAEECFKQVNQKGTSNLPFPQTTEELEKASKGTKAEQEEAKEASGWSLEISLDIESVHATCESCKILLVEAKSASFKYLEEAEETAVKNHATEISNSWGGAEAGEDIAGAKAFDHPDTVITAAAGDDGYLNWDEDEEHSAERGYALFPASSPDVVAVGGTHLSLDQVGKWENETVWNDGGESEDIRGGDGASGGGCSDLFSAPVWQQSDSLSVGCTGKRAVADVAADADPYTGIAIRDTVPGSECETTYEEVVAKKDVKKTLTGWCTIGGTSLASPLVASVFALAGGAKGVEYPAETLYENEIENPTALHDIVSGSNGECTEPFNEEEGLSGCTTLQEATSCSGAAICLAREGYDGPTGVGTPNGIVAFEPVSAAIRQANEEKQREAKKKEEEEKNADSDSSGGSTTGSSMDSADGTAGVSGSSSSGTTAPSPSATSSQPTIKLTAFALTPTALLALDRARPKVSSVRFAFTLSAAARVRATLAKLVRVHGHNRWISVAGALTFSAAKGRDQQHLTSSDGLVSGRYRLTLAPQGGAAHTLTFQVG